MIFEGKVPAAKPLDVREALENPFVTETGRIQTIPLSQTATVKILRNPVICDEELELVGPPALGEHTDDLLLAAGFSASEIAGFRRQGTI
jgi:crotonobetainyl-CoA:carnitine CoA-transferase CaiB-like acyl-CoA transferase